MNGLELKQKWQKHIPSFGAFLTSTDPVIAAEMCNIGFEWLIIDAEHNPFNPETLRDQISILRYRGVVPVVRVADNSISLIKQVLDYGAEGVMIPMLCSVDAFQQGVLACRYPPRGVRGFNPRDPTNNFHNLDEYLKTINDRVIVMPQVEHIDAVKNLDAVLEIEGIDAIMIGPADLSFSMGVPNQIDHPEVQKTLQTIIDKGNAKGIPMGIAVFGTPPVFVEWVKRGITFQLVGTDYGYVYKGGKPILEESVRLAKALKSL